MTHPDIELLLARATLADTQGRQKDAKRLWAEVDALYTRVYGTWRCSACRRTFTRDARRSKPNTCPRCNVGDVTEAL